jgi:hypothetical protein
MILTRDCFYTLRLFGCFGIKEPEFRLLKQITKSKEINLSDKLFDFISIGDFSSIVEHYIQNSNLPKDINCVYKEKYKLSEIVKKFIHCHDLKVDIKQVETADINYTGNSSKLENLKINLNGLDYGIENYYS